MPRSLYIGLMSGTSLDGVDIALVDLSNHQPILLAQTVRPYPSSILNPIKNLCRQQDITFDELGKLDAVLGVFFADSILQLISANGINSDQIVAIGSHGQTVQHQPLGDTPYTLQIGDANRIVEKTDISVVADFRRRDIAAGGQGAPLVPAFHQAYFHSSSENRAIINIGGIANITYLPMDTSEPVIGFDCGPGNTLMDQYCQQHFNQHFDKDATRAQSGSINNELLKQMLDDSYFSLDHPKSTGPEYFSLHWLESHVKRHPTSATDILATLCELSVLSINIGLQQLPQVDKVYICGGGTQNPLIMKQLTQHLSCPVTTTNEIGINSDWVEAMAFAWLAKQTIEGKKGNIPSVTGATKDVILGAIYQR